VRGNASTVEAYIEEAPNERRDGLRLLRRLCQQALRGFDETLRYGMPAYLREGVVEVGFASQKAYISLYVLRQQALEAHLDRLAGVSVGKGCIRFRRPEQIDREIIRALLIDAANDSGPIC
jgi:uncharacterized protein YdhG (YjbR/CyaY superfamily)